jgi:myo-inositol-1(or 4)-monophosphatase
MVEQAVAQRDEWLDRRLICARRMVREAGALALHYYRQPDLKMESKGVQDYVSIADRAAEALIVDGLRDAFPSDAFLGEEGGYQAAGTDDDALWVIDPIDGTTNYAHGLPLWCVSLALLQSGVIRAGIIFNPVTNEFYEAAQGRGAYCNGVRMQVSGVQVPGRARIGLGFSYRRPPALHAEAIVRLLSSDCEYARLGSGALGMAYVADGRFDGYWEPHINAWDVLAGICLVREAGGHVNDFLAADGLHQGNPIMACTPALTAYLDERLMSLCEGV